MRQRIYFLLPDTRSARRTMDDLLLARIEERHIHFVAQERTQLEGLHAANLLQTSDVVPAAEAGLIHGGIAGIVLAVAAGWYLSDTTAQWQAVLRSASALEAYRRYYVREILAWKAAEFLIFSDSFPRSLHFCMAQVDEFLRRILGETGTRPRSPAARASRRLLADLQSLTITDVLHQGLHEFLMEIQAILSSISDEVVETTMFYPAESVLEEQQQQQQQ